MISASLGEEKSSLEILKFQMRVGVIGSKWDKDTGRKKQSKEVSEQEEISPVHPSQTASVWQEQGDIRRGWRPGQSCCVKYFGLCFNNSKNSFWKADPGVVWRGIWRSCEWPGEAHENVIIFTLPNICMTFRVWKVTFFLHKQTVLNKTKCKVLQYVFEVNFYYPDSLGYSKLWLQ